MLTFHLRTFRSSGVGSKLSDIIIFLKNRETEDTALKQEFRSNFSTLETATKNCSTTQDVVHLALESQTGKILETLEAGFKESRCARDQNFAKTSRSLEAVQNTLQATRSPPQKDIQTNMPKGHGGDDVCDLLNRL